MLNKTSSKALLLASGAVVAGLAFGPTAGADPGSCTSAGSATVCQGQETATPPVLGGSGQNGSYGPSGDTPPVGN